MTATPVASSAIVRLNTAGSTAALAWGGDPPIPPAALAWGGDPPIPPAALAWGGDPSEEGVTGVEREAERHPAVVLRGRVEIAENVGGDRAHIAPAPLDRALVTQRAGTGHLHQVLDCRREQAARVGDVAAI